MKLPFTTPQNNKNSQGRKRRSPQPGKKGFEQRIRAVPARFMQPRIILILCVFALLAFGLIMVYSASSITALKTYHNATHFLKQQFIFMLMGTILAALIARFVDYHWLSPSVLAVLSLAASAVLVLVRLVGRNVNGAARWLHLGPVNIQPSEFVKVIILLVVARLIIYAIDLKERGLLTRERIMWPGLIGVVLPLFLIFIQPDKGSTMILFVSILLMLYLSGFSPRILWLVFGVAVLAFVGVSIATPYSRARFTALMDPWTDPLGNGYQLLQGFFAFANGRIFGLGLGFSREKYLFLPEQHNDFIFPIVGEELGLIGAVALIALLALFVWAGFKIARRSSDLYGSLIASGATSLIAVQSAVNIMGVLGNVPMSGKPLPFISYGGSSIMSVMVLVGLILSVSRVSRLPRSVYDERREQLSFAGSPRPHGSRGSSRQKEADFLAPALPDNDMDSYERFSAQRAFTVLSGGAALDEEDPDQGFQVRTQEDAGSALSRRARGQGLRRSQLSRPSQGSSKARGTRDSRDQRSVRDQRGARGQRSSRADKPSSKAAEREHRGSSQSRPSRKKR